MQVTELCLLHAGLQLIVTEVGCPEQGKHLDNTDGFSCALGMDPVNFLKVFMSPEKEETVQYRFGDLVSWTNSVSWVIIRVRVRVQVTLELCVQVLHAGTAHLHTKLCDFEMYSKHGPQNRDVMSPYRMPQPMRLFWYMDFDPAKVLRDGNEAVTHHFPGVVPAGYNAVVKVTWWNVCL